MKLSALALPLTLANMALLGALAVGQANAAPDVAPVVRARLIELVDARGQVRAQLKTEDSGEVVMRLRDQTGAIRVKLGAGEHGSGLLLNNEKTEPGVHMLAGLSQLDHKPATQITLADGKGRRRLYAEHKRHIYGGCPSPDGRYLLFTRSEVDLGRVDNSRTSMAIIRMADTPMVGGEDGQARAEVPSARRGPILDLSWGWEPHWTYASIL